MKVVIKKEHINIIKILLLIIVVVIAVNFFDLLWLMTILFILM